MAVPARAHVPGQVEREWTEDDVATFSRFLVKNKWTLKDGRSMQACLMFKPPRPMQQVYTMCTGLKARKAGRWQQYWMPLGEVHGGRKGNLLDSLPTHNSAASNVLSQALGPRSWTIEGMKVVSEFHEAKKAGSSVPTFRELANANAGVGLCVKQVCCRSCAEHCRFRLLPCTASKTDCRM